MADLDLTLVRSFTVVAEQRHFGRAAPILNLTPSSLSRQITRLERQVGARLLARTPRGTELTDAGRAFLPLAEQTLRMAGRAASGARAAAQPAVITIGFTVNIIITPAVRELRRSFPKADVRTLYLERNEPRTPLLDGRVDAAVARLPFPADGLDVTMLYDEPLVLLVPLDHRLAGKDSVTLDDIEDEPMPRTADPAWNAFWRVDPRPDGRPAPDGPLVTTIEDKVEVIADGRAVAIVPASAPVSARPDLTTIPLEGVEPGHVALVTRSGDHRPLVEAFRSVSSRLVAGHVGYGDTHAIERKF